MTTSIIKELKRLVYGTFPCIYMSTLSPSSPKLTYYRFIKKYGYTHYPYDFAAKYIDTPIDIRKDEEKGLHYVMHQGTKKLYYPRYFEVCNIEKNYKALLIEQDICHAHHYVDSLSEFEGKILLDVGSAEGLTSLDAIDRVDFVYLFECDSEWIEALNATFEPWKQKIAIVEKYINKYNDEANMTLDEFFKDKPRENLFLKMDIEGAECDALSGAEELFAVAKNLDFAICTYHRKNDKQWISDYLDRHQCDYFHREGYFYVKHKLRSALVRGHKN